MRRVPADIHAARGDWPILPFVPGHEGIGVVERGGRILSLGFGGQVGIPWRGYACGLCGALQYARIFGADMVAVDVTEAKLRLASGGRGGPHCQRG